MPTEPVARPSTADLYAGFFFAGMATTLLGPLVPVLSRAWGLSDASVGLLFSTQFLSSVAITLISSSLAARFAATRVLVVGFLLLAVGIGTLGFAAWPVGLASTMCYGFGLGLVLPTTNFLVAAINPGREAAAVSLVNVAWSAGAVTWPVIVARLGTERSVAVPTVLLAAIMVIVAGRLARVLRAGQPAATVPPRPVAGRTSAAPAASAPSASPLGPVPSGREIAWMAATFGAVFFVYSGTESAIGGWVAEHVRRMTGGHAGSHWAMAPTTFWAAIAAGRLITPSLLRHLSERTVLRAGAIAAIVASGLLAAASSERLAFAATAAAGLGLAPVFPIAFGQMSRRLAPHSPHVVGPVYALTGVGAAALPWIVGVSSTLTGSLRAGLAVPVLGGIVLLALIVFALEDRRRAPGVVLPTTGSP